MLVNCSHCFVVKTEFSKKSFRNTKRVSNSLDSDQAHHLVGPDLGPKTVCKGYKQAKSDFHFIHKTLYKALKMKMGYISLNHDMLCYFTAP